MKVVIITHIQAPYQVELFNALSAHMQLSVVFMNEITSRRPWKALSLAAPSITMTQPDAEATAMSWCANADLVVYNWYQDARVLKWMRDREAARKPWVFWGERPGYKLPPPLGSWYRKLKLQTLHRSHAPIWGIGSWAVEKYREEFGTARKYENVPYFSDLSRFQNASVNAERTRGSRTFLYSGKLNERKGVDLILNAADTLFSKHPNARLMLAGDGPLRPRTETLAAKYPGRVDVLGLIPWERLPEVYARADVLLAPSRYDGWNLAVPEGLAAGLPVISTKQTGAALELIHHGKNGWTVPSGSLAELTEAIDQALVCALPSFSAEATVSAVPYGLERGAKHFKQAACAAYETWHRPEIIK